MGIYFCHYPPDEEFNSQSAASSHPHILSYSAQSFYQILFYQRMDLTNLFHLQAIYFKTISKKVKKGYFCKTYEF